MQSSPYSDWGQRLSGPSGIQELMDDLGQAMSIHRDMLMLGGGQPAAIPEVQQLWRESIQQLLQDGDAMDRTLLNYDPPIGNPEFRAAFAQFLQRECDWSVDHEHIGVLPSSQSAMFLLFNLLSGNNQGKMQKVLFPIMPEYIGYSNQAANDQAFVGLKPIIENISEYEFKYRIDFKALEKALDDSIAAVCISCPTNPTGNVISQSEFERLFQLTQQHGIPLIIDSAYGYPFPHVIHTEFKPTWRPGIIFSISLSKVGLPGVRNSIIVASPELIEALNRMNANTALANGNLGQALLKPHLNSDRIPRLCTEIIRPFYAQKSQIALELLHAELDSRVTWQHHSCDGAFFLWLYFPDLKIGSKELYQRLKQRKVLVIPGHYFFFGIDEDWSHRNKCLRITTSQSQAVLREAIAIIAEEVEQACH